MIQVCTNCIYSSAHPLGITFNDAGLCSGCQVHLEKYQIDWTERELELKALLSSYKSSSNYDCIVPVTGSGDSFFIVDKVKNYFGMNPLLVTYNNQFNTSVGVRNLARLKSIFDCDLMTMTVNPEKVKKITRETLLRKGSIYWHSLAGQSVFPVKIACSFKIPLIVWGAHQGVDQVGMFSHHDRVEMTRKYRHEHDLMGVEAKDLMNGFENLSEEDLTDYFYPEDFKISSVGVRGIYLSNYMFWNSRRQHEDMIKRYSYESMKQTRTFDSYSNCSCWNYSDLHDYIKFIKHGYGKVVDHATREIRLGQMTRFEALELARRYLFIKPKNATMFYKWLGVSEVAFEYLINQFRNSEFWKLTDNLDWNYNNPIFSSVLDTNHEDLFTPYLSTPEGISTDPSNEYIIYGKGVS